MKEAYLYQKLDNNSVQCQTCNHNCIIKEGKRGICGIRENQQGKLYLLTYGRACAENIDPVEKKPLYHFLAHTKTLTIATVGCNLRCDWCQNYDISQGPKDHSLHCEIGQCDFLLPPAKIVGDALSAGCPSISYSYTEPTVYLEYALDTMKLAHKKKLKNIWVSNGYMSKESLGLVIPYLDAINVDIKTIDKNISIKYLGISNPELVLNNCQTLVKKGLHLEITTLIVPTVNDDKEQLQKIAQFINDQLGPEIPWHLSRYFPAYKMLLSATPISKLDEAQEIAQKAGLRYVYLGNIYN